MNIFDVACDLIVIPVNCKGVMGAGLAYQFKKRYPAGFEIYKQMCDNGVIRPGLARFYKDDDVHACFFPTKDDWRNTSKIEYIKSGMQNLVEMLNCLYSGLNFTVAFPKLGCGLGGLNWEYVEAVMLEELNSLDPSIKVVIC